MSERIILVTGGSNGIGKAVAESFAETEDQVTVWGRHPERLQAMDGTHNGRITAEQVDVSQLDQVQRAVGRLITRHSRIDVLVNAAGFTGQLLTTTPIEEAVEIWDDVVSTNLRGCFLVCQAAVQHITRPGGRIINISSIAASTGSSRPGGLAYASAKAGVEGLTLALARELGPEGITVNAVAPGFIDDTGITDTWDASVKDWMVGQTPLGRAGLPQDIAAEVMYLASSGASFVHGQVRGVNGGWLPGR